MNGYLIFLQHKADDNLFAIFFHVGLVHHYRNENRHFVRSQRNYCYLQRKYGPCK
jgi:hypothetical protein